MYDRLHVFDVATSAVNDVRRACPQLTSACNLLIVQIATERAKIARSSVDQSEMEDTSVQPVESEPNAQPDLFDPDD